MQDGSILTGIQMPPFALGLMIVERTKGTAYGTSPLAVVLMGQVDVHLSLLKFQFHALHLPRSFDTQNASIQFMILHSVIFAWRRDISQNQRGCLSQSFPFPSISGTGSERPAAVKGAPVFRRGAAYLDGEDRSETLTTGRKGGSSLLSPTIKSEFPEDKGAHREASGEQDAHRRVEGIGTSL